jgi:hypothetical protein
MYPFLTYPLDVIKTNRILQTSFAKEGAESIPKELTALYEKGHLKNGLFRGAMVGLALSTCQNLLTNPAGGISAGVIVTIITNPLNVL